MGIASFLGRWNKCPYCQKYTAKSFLGSVECATRTCKHYNLGFSEKYQHAFYGDEIKGSTSSVRGDRVYIKYKNHRGEDVLFNGETNSLELVKNHLKVKVFPKDQFIYLSKDKISNYRDFSGLVN
ncbi:MAG: hypothetical protein HOE90_20100 [Bacteriovoracaceae bacterium]|nr:hypothetical protein [Bacteriovoracaceae bacterium]